MLRPPGARLLPGDRRHDVGKDRQIKGIGETGNGSGQGFLLHNAILVQAGMKEFLGLAGQSIYYCRKGRQTHRRQNASQRLKRERESQVWGEVIDHIGARAEGVVYIHVFDRGADNFEVLCRLLENRSEWVKVRPELQRVHDLTVREFYREVAKLGGFLELTGDGEPGWMTLWRGWDKPNTYVAVATKLKYDE